MIDAWTGNVEVAVYLTDPVNPDTVKLLTNKLEGLPAVADVQYESKEDACATARMLFRDSTHVHRERRLCDGVPGLTSSQAR